MKQKYTLHFVIQTFFFLIYLSTEINIEAGKTEKDE
jgi:hypothetical protein